MIQGCWSSQSSRCGRRPLYAGCKQTVLGLRHCRMRIPRRNVQYVPRCVLFVMTVIPSSGARKGSKAGSQQAPTTKDSLMPRCRNADLQTIHASTARIVALASSLLFASYLLQCRQKLLRRCRWLHSAFKDRLERSILTVHVVDCVLVSADLRSAHVSACERSTRI